MRSVHAGWRAAVLVLAAVSCRPGPSRSLVVAYPAGAATLSPFSSNEEFTTSVLANVYEPLVDLDEDLALRPMLAESWNTPDELTWMFRLRSPVRLHDGRLLTAREAAASLEEARTDPASRLRAELAAVASVEALDARTLRIRTAYPVSTLPNRLGSVPIAVSGKTSGERAGTGPFRVRSHKPGGQSVLEAFEGYWGERPVIRRVVFRVIPDRDRRISALKRGEADLIIDVPARSLRELESVPGVRVLRRRGLRVIFLGINCGPELRSRPGSPNPFRDVRARRAVALAIDREALVRWPLEGEAERTDSLVAPEVFGYSGALTSWQHDPETARRLLAAAGRPESFEVPLGYMPGKYRGIEGVIASIQTDLARVGIRVVPWAADPATFISRLEQRQMDLYVMGWISNSGDAGVSYDYLVHTPGPRFGSDNGGGYSNSGLDRILEQAAGMLSASSRESLLRKAAELVHEEAPVIPLYRQNDLYAVARGLLFRPRLDRRIHAALIRWSAP